MGTDGGRAPGEPRAGEPRASERARDERARDERAPDERVLGDWHERGDATRLTHCGYDAFDCNGFVNPPVVRGSTVLYPDAATLRSRGQAYTYGTAGTPTTRALTNLVARMEGADGTVLTSSGLSAISLPMLALLAPGDHVLMVDSVYFPARRFAASVLARMGVGVEYYGPGENAAVAERFRPETRLVHLESPASNTFEVQDVAAIAGVARERGVLTAIDNTYATPLLFRALDHGVDVVMEAATKYPSGHSDVLMGFVSARGEVWERIDGYATDTGNCVGSDDASLVLRGMRTMALRLERQGASALALAEWLAARPEVLDVLHPALPTHPTHALFARQFRGSSGIFSFVLDGDDAAADRFLDATRLFGLGYSWAGYESLAVPVNLADRTIATGPGRGTLVRLQIGLEDVDDLKADLAAGLRAASGA